MDKQLIKNALKELFINRELEIVVNEESTSYGTYLIIRVFLDEEPVYEHRQYVY